MSNEYIQKEQKPVNYSDNDLHKNNAAEAQIIVAEAYLEDRKKWENKLKLVSLNIANKTKELSDLNVAINKQSKFKSFLFKVLHIKTKNELRLVYIKSEIDELKNQLMKVNSVPPNIDAYDLAMIGNNLFAAR